MPKAIITRSQASKIVDFCTKNGEKQFFFAKDQGAYFGATTGTHANNNFSNIIFYQEGMNPDVSEEANGGDWYDNARIAWGGDDFGIHIDISALYGFVDDESMGGMFTFQID
jgi:hypothetical protein